MSKGPGKLQMEILSLMRGESKRHVFAAGPLVTEEILEEMRARDLLVNLSRKIAMGAIRRSCDGLVARKLMKCKWTSDEVGRKTIEWEVI